MSLLMDAIAADLKVIRGQLDHLATDLHDHAQQTGQIIAFIDQHKPALERATRLLANPVSAYLDGRKAARNGR